MKKIKQNFKKEDQSAAAHKDRTPKMRTLRQKRKFDSNRLLLWRELDM